MIDQSDAWRAIKSVILPVENTTWHLCVPSIQNLAATISPTIIYQRLSRIDTCSSKALVASSSFCLQERIAWAVPRLVDGTGSDNAKD